MSLIEPVPEIEPKPVVDPPDPMKECTLKVEVDDPVHPGMRCVLYYPAGKVPAKFMGKEVALKARGVKEPKIEPKIIVGVTPVDDVVRER